MSERFDSDSAIALAVLGCLAALLTGVIIAMALSVKSIAQSLCVLAGTCP